jgi:hypothetical protein
MKRFVIILGFLSLAGLINAQSRNVGDTTWVGLIDFETPCSYLYIDTSQSNLWQIGKPSQIFLDSAWSPVNAIMTDTANNYPVNNHSYFDLHLVRDYFSGGTFMSYYLGISIRHKFDTDSLRDGGYLSISYDQGQSFVNVIDDNSWTYGSPPDWSSQNIYYQQDTLYNGEHGFSGRSNGWVTSGFSWITWPVKQDRYTGDTAIIRFNFISDDIDNNREGWLIDDISFFWVDMGSTIDSYRIDDEQLIFPNPASEIVTLSENEIIKADFIDEKGQIVYSVSDQKEVNISGLKDGMYIVRMETKQSVLFKKLLIRR